MASSSWIATPSLPTGRKRVIGELTRGREIADKLRQMLRDQSTGASVLPAQGLVGKILDTFTESLSILCAAGESDIEVSQDPAVVNSTVQKPEDSGESCKTPAPKDRRGSYKRRRTSETSIKETPTWIEDGHAWRKYGQKVILHATHPRNYFRCTHKFEQGCQATKQVQQIQDDPPLIRTTYHGRHTCKNLFKSSAQEIIVDNATGDSSILWNFQSQEDYKPHDSSTVVRDHSTVSTSIKQEISNEDCHQQIKSPALSVPSDRDDDHYFVSAFDHIVTSAGHFGAFSTGSDHGDVISSDLYSCTASTHSHSMDMADMMAASVNLDDYFLFDKQFS